MSTLVRARVVSGSHTFQAFNKLLNEMEEGKKIIKTAPGKTAGVFVSSNPAFSAPQQLQIFPDSEKVSSQTTNSRFSNNNYF